MGRRRKAPRGRGNQPVRERKKTASERKREKRREREGERERLSAGDAAGRQANRTSATWSRPRWEAYRSAQGMLARSARGASFDSSASNSALSIRKGTIQAVEESEIHSTLL